MNKGTKGVAGIYPWGLLLRAVISFILIAFVLYWIGAQQFMNALLRLDVKSMGMIFILYCISLLLRSWRFRVAQESLLCRPNLSYAVIAAYHNAANQVMPFRSGELTFPLLVKRYFGHRMSRSTASLLLIRFVEALVLGCLVIMGLLLVLGHSGENHTWEFFLIPALLLMLAAWVFLPRMLLFMHHVALSVAGGRKVRWADLVIRLAQVLQSISAELGRSKDVSVHLLILVLTIMNWLVLIGVCWAVLLSLGVQVTYPETIVGSSVASVAQFIPLGSLGNIGPLEAGWTLGFVLVGLDAKTALNAGVVLHLVMISYALILAGLAWLFYGRRLRKEAHFEQP